MNQNEVIKTLNGFSYAGKVDDVSAAVTLSEELFTQSNRIADGKVLILYVTGATVKTMKRSTLDMLQRFGDEGMIIVFVISGELGRGSRDTLLSIVGQSNRLIYLNVDGIADGNVPNAITSKGLIFYILPFEFYER